MNNIKNIFNEKKSNSIKIKNDILGVKGLSFCRNRLYKDGKSSDDVRIHSNKGNIVNHYVTHHQSFINNRFGAHKCQLDRLTFFSTEQKSVLGRFIDCRINSKTYGKFIEISIPCNPDIQLEIPPGIAHSFDNIHNVVTRNDMTTYVSPSISANDLFEDDVFVCSNKFNDIKEVLSSLPKINPGTLELPPEASVSFFGMITQNLTESTVSTGILGSQIRKMNYHNWSEKSYIVLPTQKNCISETLIIYPKNKINFFNIHTLSDSFFTFLSPEESKIYIELIDLRRYSETYNKKRTIEINVDPSSVLEIPSGVAFKFSHENILICKVEYKNYYSSNSKLDEHINFDADDSNAAMEISKKINNGKIKIPDKILMKMYYEDAKDCW